MATAPPPSHSPLGCPSPAAGLQMPRQLRSSMVTTSPSASTSPSSPKCLRETGRGVVGVVGRPPIPTTPCSLPGTPLTVRTEQLLPSKAHIRAPHLGKGLGEGRPGWGPPHSAGAGVGVTLPAHSCPGPAPAAAAPAPLGQSPLAATHKGRVSVAQRPPCPTQPWATHLRDGVDGGLGLTLPTPALAEGCTEGRRDAGGEAQVQLQPPGAH